MSLLLSLVLYFQDGRSDAFFEPPAEVCAQKAKGYRGLFIGIDKYVDLKNLKTPENDIRDLAGLLKASYGFWNMKLLRNEQATRRAILEHLKCLAERSNPEDSVLVYFAGHGMAGSGQSGYWLPHDAKRGDISSFISNSDLLGFAESCKAKHVLIISDACFSGSIFKGSGTPHADEVDHIRSIYDKKSRWVISSGFDTTVDDVGPGEKHSPFAHHLLHALRDNRDPYITPRKLVVEMILDVTRDSKHGQYPQSGVLPESGHKGGSFVFWNTGAMQDGSPFPPPWEAKAEEYLPLSLRNLKGRRILVENGGTESMKQALMELGMEVTWDSHIRRRFKRQIVSNCGTVAQQSILALQDLLKLKGYELKTHGDDPKRFRDTDCGLESEITIRN